MPLVRLTGGARLQRAHRVEAAPAQQPGKRGVDVGVKYCLAGTVQPARPPPGPPAGAPKLSRPRSPTEKP